MVLVIEWIRGAAPSSRSTNEMEDCLILAIQLLALLVASEVVVLTEVRLVGLVGAAGLVEEQEIGGGVTDGVGIGHDDGFEDEDENEDDVEPGDEDRGSTNSQ